MHRFKKHWWGMISSVILIAFTGYMLMDTFLLTKVYVVANDKKENKSDNDTENEQQEAVSTGTTYSDRQHTDYSCQNIGKMTPPFMWQMLCSPHRNICRQHSRRAVMAKCDRENI